MRKACHLFVYLVLQTNTIEPFRDCYQTETAVLYICCIPRCCLVLIKPLTLLCLCNKLTYIYLYNTLCVADSDWMLMSEKLTHDAAASKEAEWKVLEGVGKGMEAVWDWCEKEIIIIIEDTITTRGLQLSSASLPLLLLDYVNIIIAFPGCGRWARARSMIAWHVTNSYIYPLL